MQAKHSDPSDAPTRVGRYMLFDQLASGGMATVHLARMLGPAGFTRTVAVKRLHAHLAREPEFVSMLIDEAVLASRVTHPNVVSAVDVVRLEDEVLLVMEFVRGETLSRLVKSARAKGLPIPPRIVSSVIGQALLGLHAAHEATDERGDALAIVHRDISPQNLMVGADGMARVLDFGIAKAVSRLQETREGALKGKLAYMSPEQISAAAVDHRSDLFSMGVVMWEALVSQRLFDREDPLQVISGVMECRVPPVSSLRPDLPVELDIVLARALDPSPANRFQSAREMVVALHAAIPPATTLEVADWVQSLEGETLRARAERVSEIESSWSSVRMNTALKGVVLAAVAGKADPVEPETQIVETRELIVAQPPRPRSEPPRRHSEPPGPRLPPIPFLPPLPRRKQDGEDEEPTQFFQPKLLTDGEPTTGEDPTTIFDPAATRALALRTPSQPPVDVKRGAKHQRLALAIALGVPSLAACWWLAVHTPARAQTRPSAPSKAPDPPPAAPPTLALAGTAVAPPAEPDSPHATDLGTATTGVSGADFGGSAEVSRSTATRRVSSPSVALSPSRAVSTAPHKPTTSALSPSSHCNPPYLVVDGIRRYKLECLGG